MIHTINGAAFRQMVFSAAAAIEHNKQPINELNVFPVPDGDTGTNMSMTMGAAVPELQALADVTLTKAADKTASALLRGARGNSGVILSLLFRGLSKALKGAEECDGTLLADALQAGVDAAYKAVMKPAEGTILTVSRLAAAAARQSAAECDDAEAVLMSAIEAGQIALDDTIHQNPVLEKAGVVDAGGKGWLIILDAMLRALRGEAVEAPTQSSAPKEQADFTDFNTEDITFAFDTVFIVRKATEDVDLSAYRAYLDTIGDSIVVGEDDEAFKVHVHTNIPGEAITEAQKYGTLELAKIENMQMQHDDLASGHAVRSTDDLEKIEQELEQPQEPAIAPAEKPLGIVAVCAGDGIANVFRELGADGIISGGQTMNPSTQDILTQINRTPAETVFVFPNNKNIIMAAEQTVGLTEKRVVVIPSKTIPQGISALLAFDPEGDVDTLVDAMTEAMANVMTMQITYAARNSDFDGHDIHEGDYLALSGSALVGTDRDVTALLEALARQVQTEGKEYVTIYFGQDLTEADAQQAVDIFAGICPDADIALVNGGQPVYYYLISAE